MTRSSKLFTECTDIGLMPDRYGDINNEADRMRRVSAFEVQLDSDEAKCILVDLHAYVADAPSDTC
jgi:hypothetical protein